MVELSIEKGQGSSDRLAEGLRILAKMIARAHLQSGDTDAASSPSGGGEDVDGEGKEAPAEHREDSKFQSPAGEVANIPGTPQGWPGVPSTRDQ